MKRGLLLFGMILMVITALTGCGNKQKANGGEQDKLSKETVYSSEALPIDGEKYTSLVRGEDGVFVYGYQWDADNIQELYFAKVGNDGAILSENSVRMNKNQNIYEIKPDKAGFFYGIKSEYFEDEMGNYSESYYLVKYSMDGQEIFCVDLKSVPQLQEFFAEGYFYAGLKMVYDDVIYVDLNSKFARFDLEGNFIDLFKGNGWDAYSMVQLYELESGKVAAVLYSDEGNGGTKISYVNMKTGDFEEIKDLTGNSYGYSFYSGIGYDFFLVNNYGVYGYNVGDADVKMLMSYINSDVNVYELYNLVPVSETEFYACQDDSMLGTRTICKFTKVDPANVKDKTVITLACNYLDWDVRMAVFDFNKASDEYKIIVEDYGSLYSNTEDYQAGLNRLNTDIAAGKIPDILLLSYEMPIKSYIAKGLFEDLIPYIEKDPELSLDSYMPNIIEAFSVDGKMYQLVPHYSVNTLVAKASLVGEERGWTAKEIMDILEKSPEGTQFLSYETRDNMLNNCLTVAGDQFIDWETGTCNFESEEFTQLLAFLSMFPEEIDNEAYTDEYWMTYDSLWRENKVIAQPLSLYDIQNYNYLEKGTFGEKITMVGYPSGNGNGSAIVPELQFALSSKSDNKEGAWQFLRYFLTDEYQMEKLNYGMPLSVAKLDLMLEKAQKVPTYTDEQGNEVESPETYYIGDVEIPISPMTKDEAAALREEILSFSTVYNYDQNLINIVKEESAAYFNGQKPAEEVAKIIQSRAKIYINENR